MKQKRQQFHKEIRRQALQTILRKKRQQLIYSNNKKKQQIITQQTYNQLALQSKSILTHYSQQLKQSIISENIENIFCAIKQSYYEIKKILNKGKHSANIQRCIGQHWFQYGFDSTLIEVVRMFQTIDKNSFVAVRKQIYKYSVMHFYSVLRFQVRSLQIKAQSMLIKDVFNFLFYTIVELSNLPESINQIILIVGFLLNESKQVRHEFLFRNNKLQQQQNQKLLSFQNLVYVMFQNRDKFSSSLQYQEDNKQNYNQIKMNFIGLFIQYGYQLKEMEKYIQRCKKTTDKSDSCRNDDNGCQMNETCQKTLRMYGFPTEVKFKMFLQKQPLAIISQTINQMRQYYLLNWQKSTENQDYLATCIQATRLMIDFTRTQKILKSLQDQLGEFINILRTNSLNISVKNETIFLLDSIIYFDEQNYFTQFMINNHNLFQTLWSYHDESIFSVKMNIVNNLLLCTAGFHAINRYLSEVVISLHGTHKYIGFVLSFINNYFINTKYDLEPTSRVDLLIQLLYSLPGEYYTKQNLELQCYIFKNLYDKSFKGDLPERYSQWKKQLYFTKKQASFERLNQTKFFQTLCKILDIYSHYAKQWRLDY